MNAIAQHAPQQLSVATRAGVAFAALALIAGTVTFADDASEHAVVAAQAAINPAIRYVVLPAVEVVAKRQAGEVADAACAAPQMTAAAGQI
jgi:hypothetical protein